jgi:hypothetical protein
MLLVSNANVPIVQEPKFASNAKQNDLRDGFHRAIRTSNAGAVVTSTKKDCE